MSIFESRFFLIGDNSIHYQTSGHGPVPVVFVHGFASAHDTWRDIAILFPPDRFILYLLDLKGFGLSGKPKDGAYSIDDQVEVLRSFILHAGLLEPVIVAHSLGGAIALLLCLRNRDSENPFTIGQLILIDCAAYQQRLPRFFRRLRSPFVGPLLLHLTPTRLMVKGMLERAFYDPALVCPERFARFVKYFSGRRVPYALRETVKAIDPERFVHIDESYRTLKVRTLIIWGEDDRIIKVKNGRRLHENLAGSELRVLKRCGHLPQEERPAETYAAIEAFLAGAASRAGIAG
jgi:pimeloyl-ACP methyl ester carboxylesterase